MVEVVPSVSVEALIPVPGDPDRAWERGDVPARALASELARLSGLRMVDALARTRALRRQRGLSLEERRRNVRGSVKAQGAVAGEVCVVDDVYTSGATVDACARACRAAGARTVRVVTFARAVR